MTTQTQSPRAADIRETLTQELIARGWDPEDAAQAVHEHLGEAELDAVDVARPMDIGLANWVVGRAADAEAELASIDKMFTEEVERLKRRVDALKRPIQRRRESLLQIYGSALVEFARAHTDSRRRSVNLLRGRIGFRKTPAMVVYDTSKERVLDCLKHRGFERCIRTVESVDKIALKDLLQSELTDRQREMLCGVVHLEPGQDKFYVDTDIKQ